MDEPAFSDFGSKAPRVEGRVRSKAAIASMVLGLLGPISCAGGVFITASAFESLSYRGAVVAMVLPITLSLTGLLLGSFAFFRIATRPDKLRGAGFAGAGLALNLIGGALNVLMATQMVRLGSMAGGTILYAIRTIDEGESDEIGEVFHESVREDLTPQLLETFRDRLRESLGEPQRGVGSLGELLGVRWPDAVNAARISRTDTDLPAVPIWFENGRALVVLSVHEDIASQISARFFGGSLTLESLVIDIRVIDEAGEIIQLFDPRASQPRDQTDP